MAPRERYQALDLPNIYSAKKLRAEFDRVQRGIPHPLYVDLRDFTQNLGAGSDYSAAILKAGTEARNAKKALFIPGGKFYLDSTVDFSSLFGVTILGNGHNSSPSFDGQATQLVMRADDAPILKVWGPCTIENLYLAYEAQQTTSDTDSIALSLNDISGACFRNIKVYRANTSFGIPQATFGAAANIVFDSVFTNLQSYEASECHYDFRNFNGGGTNVKLSKIYANGGGDLDFDPAGQSCNYVIRGTNWFGWEWDAVSIDGLEFNQRVMDLTNCYFDVGTIRTEGVTTLKNNDGWYNLGGSNTYGNFRYVEVRNCRALVAEVTTTHFFRCNATDYHLRVNEIFFDDDCDFTATTVRVFEAAGAPTRDESHVYFHRINDQTSGTTLAPTIWTDSVSGVRVVREWNGFDVSKQIKQYQSNAQTLRFSDSAAPSATAWVVGDRVDIVAPGDLGRAVGEICTTAGTPGTWVPYALAGMLSVSSHGDVDATFTPRTSRPVNRYATTLTADRAFTLSTTGAWNGCFCFVSRPAGGAFNLNVGTGPLIALAPDEWALAVYDGSAFRVIATNVAGALT